MLFRLSQTGEKTPELVLRQPGFGHYRRQNSETIPSFCACKASGRPLVVQMPAFWMLHSFTHPPTPCHPIQCLLLQTLNPFLQREILNFFDLLRTYLRLVQVACHSPFSNRGQVILWMLQLNSSTNPLLPVMFQLHGNSQPLFPYQVNNLGHLIKAI